MAKIKRICGNCCYMDTNNHCFAEGTEGSSGPYQCACGLFDPWDNPKYREQPKEK